MSQELPSFLAPEEVTAIAEQFGTPVFVYDKATLRHQADEALAFSAPYGLTVRYAMKANPNKHILDTFQEAGVVVDASSGYEAERALLAGFDPEDILITSQELPKNLEELIEKGVEFDACSLHQLETYGKSFPGTTVGVRINPGLGSGHSNKTNVGGPASSFGIWHEHTDRIHEIAEQYDLTIGRVHTHIGSGADPAIWAKAAQLSLDHVRAFPDVTTLNLGGGFKVARMDHEVSTDIGVVGKVVAESLEEFCEETERRIHLEIEPGTFMVANAGALITTVADKVDTGEEGYEFLKVDSGMTDILRPSLYGAQHPMTVVNERSENPTDYVVVGHCCESGDLLTPVPGDAESLATRTLQQAEIGDHLIIGGVGAYCASMNAHGYNSFPETAAVMKHLDGSITQIAARGTLQALLKNELA
ncbi:MAG TPA: diaminopimelate decarboxylase [Candidatus Saccharimonadales bacterium]|jgi:diaminopimelate decarboxylase|nr:diaminopimelate decarboxylase [Candidatus Saccharimonadales bacterium]